jgi:hypothetical protein
MPRTTRSLTAIISVAFALTTLATPAVALPSRPAPDAPAAEAAWSAGQVRLALQTGGLSSPVGVVNAGDGTNRLFVLEQRGTVRVFSNNRLLSGFFLDLRSVSLSSGGERGLLGMAFHPQFESNRKLFVYYTNGGGDLVIAEMTANSARTAASTSTLDPLMTIEHSANSNHNGGQLLFGPDGYLYAFVGDGGGSGDPSGNAQNINSRLGKVLRVAPDLSGGFTTPSSNPYDGPTAGLDEIWAIGLRNPWRASFDSANGTLWIADVGQASWEEVNREPANTPGRNYGWDCREGLHNFEGGCGGLTLTDPVVEYSSSSSAGHCSVTGGYVYRGEVFEEFVGRYVLGDYCSGYLWTLVAGAGSPTLQFHRNTTALITSFGESEKGEIYMTDHAGRLYRVVAPPFSDVTDQTLIDHITWLYYEGITSGCGGGKYCPNASVSRAEMAAFLARALDLPPTDEDFFTDDDGHTLELSINRVAAAGITFGCTATRYCPASPVTREQMASFIARGFDLPATTQDFFTDDETSTHEASINRLAAAGITGGCTATKYCPKDVTTRAQMAAFLHRAIGD